MRTGRFARARRVDPSAGARIGRYSRGVEASAALGTLVFAIVVYGTVVGVTLSGWCRAPSAWLRGRPRLSRVLLVVGVLTGGFACAATRIETQWKDPATTAQDLAFRRVIAIAQVDDPTTRRVAEDEMVGVLAAGPRAQARGMQASPSYPLITAPELADVAAMRAKVEAGGFDGAVVMRLIGSEERVTYVPGRYETMWGRVVSYDPGYTRVDQIVRVETSLYSISQGKRLWSGVTRSMNPSDLPDLVEKVARAIGKELVAQGLAP